MQSLHFRTIDPPFPPHAQPGSGISFFVFVVRQLFYTLRRTMYIVIYTRRSRYHSVEKQERQPITIRDSKVRVVIRRNLCR